MNHTTIFQIGKKTYAFDTVVLLQSVTKNDKELSKSQIKRLMKEGAVKVFFKG